MSNPLFNEMMNRNNLVSQFEEFRRNFTGDPKEEVQKLLNSGRMSQQDFNRLSQMATQLQSIFGMRK